MLILEVFREKTRPQHTAIEQNRLLSSLMKPSLTRDVYVEVLKKFYGFFSPLEEKLSEAFRATDLNEMIQSRLKVPLLQKDLVFFGLDLAKIPHCENLSFLDTPAQCFGALYVTEGSTLGGQVISKTIRQSLEITSETGGSYFSGYGSQTMAVWAQTCKALEKFAFEHEAERPQMIDAAAETFDQLRQWFDQTGDEYER